MVDVKTATENFKRKLEAGYFKKRRSTNDEVDESLEKEALDTAAIEAFSQSDLFQELLSRA